MVFGSEVAPEPQLPNAPIKTTRGVVVRKIQLKQCVFGCALLTTGCLAGGRDLTIQLDFVPTLAQRLGLSVVHHALVSEQVLACCGGVGKPQHACDNVRSV